MATIEDLKAFYVGRSKNPNTYTYSETGDLIQKAKDGTIVNTITLPVYRSPTSDELAVMMEERKKRIAVAEEKYEALRKELRALFEAGADMSERMRKNHEVEVADMELQNARFALKTIIDEDGIEVRNLLFQERYETRKVPYSIARMVTSPYELQKLYVRIGKLSLVNEPIVADMDAESVAAAVALDEKPVILFSRPDSNEYGYLSMQWPADFIINERFYRNAYQALMGEIAISFEDEANLVRIMLAENPNEIEYTWEDASGATEETWNIRMDALLVPVNKAKFVAHPELGEKLIQTGNALLGAIEPMNNILGIGLVMEDTDAMRPSKWTGQNKIGRAIEQVREELKAERVKMVADATAVATAVVTADVPVTRPPQTVRIRRKIATPAVAPTAPTTAL